MREKHNLIDKMAKEWKSIDNIYLKLKPIYRKTGNSLPRRLASSKVIKKKEKQIKIIMLKANSTTNKYRRQFVESSNTYFDINDDI